MLDSTALILMEAVIDSCVRLGRVTLPDALRGPAADLLTRLVADPDLAAEYCAAVTAAHARAELEHPGFCQLLMEGDSGSIPDVEIARHGFGWLTAEQLADYVLSSNAINAIGRHLACDPDLEPHLGRWYFVAVERE